MLSRSIITVAGITLSTLGTWGVPNASAAATLTAGSSASAASASFVVNGKAGKLAPQAVASGKAPPNYNKVVSVPTLQKSQTFDILTLSATANNVKDAASSTSQTGAITSVSSASIDSLSGMITTPLGTALTMSGKKLVSSASLAKATKNTPAATVSLGSLTISSSAFGINKSYTGKPKPNFILYQNSDKSVTVYLNRQIKKTTSGNVTSISVSAVDLHVKNYSYAGQTVSGDLYVATSNAN